ncbi:MAG: gamma-glutamyltransferase [Rhizobiaceae bacterium]|nr:gamma-glutamyltransferase [Rhizobiaceae bacterium]
MRRIAAAFLFAVVAWPAIAQQATDEVAPEKATEVAAKEAVFAERQMVTAANPLAAQAGLEILRAGGSAADALVTVQTVLGLVEPQSSGIGGGAFLVYYDAASGSLTTIDGRETAPAAARPELFLDASGKPLGFFEAVVGGRSVGVPGVPALLQTIHDRHGVLDWASLLAPAVTMARDGFAVSPRLAALIAEDKGRLDGQTVARAYFYDAEGEPMAAGTLRRNPDYADTLEAIARDGAAAFYTGDIAADIVAAVRSHPTNPGLLEADDLAGYEAIEREAVCAPYRGYDVCGMGPPSSGALTVGQILGMVSHFDLGALGPEDPESWRIIGDATRLAFADRGRYMADSDFVSMPKGLLDTAYLESRAALIRRPTALPADEVQAGEPPWDKAELRIDGSSLEVPSTSHFVIVDKDGNIASMTSSVENAFGSRLMVRGFLLNNQLTDFSFSPEQDGEAVANRVEAGKRPRSSMSPTIILEDGTPAFALGSPGGSNIIPYVANAIIALVDWRMDIQQAISLPHLTNRFGRYDLEAGTNAEAFADDLAALGYDTRVTELNSGLHGVAFTADGLEGGADPRREGIAVGD